MSLPGYDITQIQQFTPEQMRLFQKVIPQLGSGFAKGLQQLEGLAAGDEAGFAQTEAPYYAALDKGLGQTATRFSQLGAQDSSAFQMAQAGQAQDLAMQLGGQRQQIQQNAINTLMSHVMNMLGQRPTETVVQEQKDPLMEIIKMLGAGGAKMGASYLGGGF